jgi:hypothetical protein
MTIAYDKPVSLLRFHCAASLDVILVTDLDNDFKFSWSEDSITSSTVLSFSVFVLVPPPYCMLGFIFL